MAKKESKPSQVREGSALLIGHGVYGPEKTEVTLRELEEMTRNLEKENEKLERSHKWLSWLSPF